MARAADIAILKIHRELAKSNYRMTLFKQNVQLEEHRLNVTCGIGHSALITGSSTPGPTLGYLPYQGCCPLRLCLCAKYKVSHLFLGKLIRQRKFSFVLFLTIVIGTSGTG